MVLWYGPSDIWTSLFSLNLCVLGPSYNHLQMAAQIAIHPQQMVHVATHSEMAYTTGHFEITDYNQPVLIGCHPWQYTGAMLPEAFWCLRTPRTHTSIRHQPTDIVPCLVLLPVSSWLDCGPLEIKDYILGLYTRMFTTETIGCTLKSMLQSRRWLCQH